MLSTKSTLFKRVMLVSVLVNCSAPTCALLPILPPSVMLAAVMLKS